MQYVIIKVSDCSTLYLQFKMSIVV